MFYIIVKLIFARGVRIVSCFLLCIFFAGSGNKIYSQDKDTVIAKEFPDITVTAGRLENARNGRFSTLTKINKSELANIGAWQANEAISKTPGAFIRNYGGLGGLKTISLRGTTAQQTLIMIDGVKLNSAQNGIIDLSILPVNFLDNIEILRGGQSGLYGGNAIGGVVNLVTSFDSKKQLSGNLGFGSFSELQASLNGFYPFGTTVFSASAGFTGSRGDYPIETNQFGMNKTVSRHNADFRNMSLTFASKTQLGNNLISARAFLRSSARGVPGAVIQNVIERNARLDENEAMLIASGISVLSDVSQISTGLSLRFSESEYRENSQSGTIASDAVSKFLNREIQWYSRYSHSGKWISSEFNTEITYSALNSDMLEPGLNNFVDRANYSLSARLESAEIPLSAFKFSFHAGSRLDAITDVASAISPMAGMSASPADYPLILKLQWSYNFRAPNFNEMYYLNYGTSTLKPERSDSWNAAIEWLPDDMLNLSISGFNIITKDQIAAVPKSPVSWSAENIEEVETMGLEISASGSFIDKKIRYSLSYTLQSSEDRSGASATKGKQVVYIPVELANAAIYADLVYLLASVTASYTGFSYYQPDNTPESIMPAYTLVNLMASRDFAIGSIRFTARAEAINILDKKYEVIKNYPMPGISFRAGVSFLLD